MQLNNIALMLLAASLSVSVHGSDFLGTVEKGNDFLEAIIMQDAKLVYADELSRFSRSPLTMDGPWPRHLPSNIDAFASGHDLVVGVISNDCGHPKSPGYAPSGCDAQWMLVLQLERLPNQGETIPFDDDRIVAAGLFSGDRNAGARSGCLGYLTAGSLRSIDGSSPEPRIEFNLQFKLVEHARYPSSCGEMSVTGTVAFELSSTNDISDGGVGNIFKRRSVGR